jgi:shikimate dehydrogenase
MGLSKIYGVVGYPVRHSLSPLMHKFWFRSLKERRIIDYDGDYRLFEVKPEEFSDFLLNPEGVVKDTEGNLFYSKDIGGFNVTIPYKVKAKELLVPADVEELLSAGGRLKRDVSAEVWYRVVSGAINTVKRDRDRTLCYNTDVWGFGKALDEDLKFITHQKNILLIGCGGAGRAVIAELTQQHREVNRIYIYDIKKETVELARKYYLRFNYIKNKLEFIVYDKIQEVIKDCQLLVNASPLGMREEDASPINKDLLHRELFVFDVVYNRETRLLKDAKERCRATTGGLGMLLYQGQRAFELWTGKCLENDDIKKAREVLQDKLNSAAK